MDSYNRLAKSSVIFAIGNIGSKLIYILLVPLYTYHLSTAQYGTVDLIITTLSLLIPIFTFSIFDAVLRFSLDNSYDRKLILAHGITITIIGFLISLLMYPIFILVFPFEQYIIYLYILLLFQSINNTLLQFARAIGKVKLFAGSSLISAFVVLICNIIFIVILDWNIEGFLLSLIFSYIISCLLLFILGRMHMYWSTNFFNTKIIKEMLFYSVPLIPNAIMWWVMGASDRYIISYMMGISANGMYAVATKLPSILNILNSVFIQAWQVAAIEEGSSKEKSQFYSNVFNVFSIGILILTSILIIFLKLILKIFVSPEYFEVWRYVPFLFLGVVFSSFSSFYGANYIAMKNTKGVFKTSIFGAVFNIIANIILVPIMGINGAAISTMLSFLLMWILRVFDTRDFVKININKKRFIFTMFIILIQIAILYINLNMEYIIQSLLFVILLLINRKDVQIIISKIIILFKTKILKKV